MPFTVLCVDDHVPTLISRAAVLERHGYRTLTAENGLEALKMVRANRQIGLIVLDSQMPKMNGGELAARIRRIRPTVPIVMVSGEPVGSRDLECVDAYLEKGWPTDYFLAVLGTLAENRSLVTRKPSGSVRGPYLRRPAMRGTGMRSV